MSISSLERVMWRIRARNKGKVYITNHELKRAIMYECGTDSRTYYQNRKALITLGWLRSRKNYVELTDVDLTDT